jgi:hypothetical protein
MSAQRLGMLGHDEIRQEKGDKCPSWSRRNFSISLDGYGAGAHQDLANPLGIGGAQLHEWLFATKSGRRMIGQDGGREDSTTTSFRPGQLV